jgi:hypothetical protein
MALMADSVSEFLAALVRCQQDPRIGEILSHFTKILDKSIKVRVTSLSVFVGAHNILYMKLEEMATNGG